MFGKGKTFFKDNSGGFAVILALTSTIVVSAIGLAIDVTMLNLQKSKLQAAADIAALSGVKELSVAGSASTKKTQIESVAKQYALSNYFTDDTQKQEGLDIVTTVDTKNFEVKVELSYTWQPFFAHYFDSGVTPIKTSATAKLAGKTLTCIIGLMKPEKLTTASIHLDHNSIVKAETCAVYSNSTSKFGLRADGSASMTAKTICSAGGVIKLGLAKFSPQPITECPEITDPLKDRKAPSYSGCDETSLNISADTDLNPGVYCNGLTISGNAKVELKSGVYVIKDGPLIVTDNAQLLGEHITFFLTGSNSIFEFRTNSTIDLSAPDKGTTAGLLFFEDRDVKYSFNFNPLFANNLPKDVRLHRISSNNARNLLGTLYLSRSILLINADAPVADASAYTAIITGRLWLQEGPILTLNSDYTSTKIPVPDGLIGKGSVLIN